MPRRGLRAIFFDAGNTLIRMDYAVIAAALRRHGFEVAAAAIERSEWRARVRLDTEVLAGGGPAAHPVSTETRSVADRYLGYILDGIGVTDARIREALVGWRRTYNLPRGLWTAVEPSAADALRLAREAGLGTAVISNSNGSVRAILDGLGLTRWLDDVIDSGEVGVEKPDPGIFRLALARSGIGPDQALYIGDLYSVDVLGARAAGIEPVLLDPGGCWGERDCRRARDTAAAVRLALTPAGA